MTFKQLFQDQRFRPILIVLMVFTVIFFELNVFVLGGAEFYKFSNDVIPAVLGGLVCFQAYVIWSHAERDQTARLVWQYLLTGMLFWTAGDLIWAYCEIVLHIDVPYPSWADAVWVVGYFCLFVGLSAQLLAYNVKPTGRVWQKIAFVELLFVVLTAVFVIIPTLKSFDASNPLANILNIAYPALDMLLFPLAFLILSTLEDGRLAVSWKIITVGLMIRAVSDVYFSYITLQGIYMPESGVNLISSLYDFIYAMSYPVIGLGFVAYRLLTTEVPVVEPERDEVEQTTWNYILVSTDRANRIITYSENFLVLLGRTDDMPDIKGAPLYSLLGLEEYILRLFVTELAQRGFVEAMVLQIKNTVGSETEARLSALAVYDALKNFSGVNMVISTQAALGSEAQLSPESQAVVRDILSKTGTLEKEAELALHHYFNAQMRMLDNLVHQYGGRTISQTMRMVINNTAAKNGWQVRKEGADFVFVEQPDIPDLAGRMAGLLSAARAYAVDMVGLQLVNSQVESVNAQTHPNVMRIVDNFALHLNGA